MKRNYMKRITTKWIDLVTFDKNWIKDKTIVYRDELQSDGSIVSKPIVYDKNHKQVYP